MTLLHAWALYKHEEKFYLPYTHWIYLKEIAKFHQSLLLLGPVKNMPSPPEHMHSTDEIAAAITIISLPWYDSYAAALKYFFSFRAAYKKAAATCTLAYIRYPVPFGWLSKYYFKPSNRIFHFVGDPVQTISANPNHSLIKKTIISTGFFPEHQLYINACRNSRVFTNGTAMAKKLSTQSIKAIPLTSSTLTEEDLHFDPDKYIDSAAPKFLYAGYLRKAKSIETILHAFRFILQKYPAAQLTIAGSGESEAELKYLSQKYQVQNSCTFTGHIEDRNQLNKLYRSHDIFLFPSVSEGSPRAVLEAMANGLPVISTPVGSLPENFQNEHQIIYARFNDAEDFFRQSQKLTEDPSLYQKIRLAAFSKVKHFTLSAFIRQIFNEA